MTRPVIHDVHRVALEPGDVLVVEVPHALSEADAAVIRHQLHELWPTHRALVLSNGVKLQIAMTHAPAGRARRATSRKRKHGR